MAKCLNCSIEFKPHYDSYGKYCSNRCQKIHQRPLFEDLKTDASRKLRLLEQVEYKCFICSISKWNDQKITLELDHIDGKHSNNTLENLRLLCPNCHSQTPTYKAKNKGHGRPNRK